MILLLEKKIIDVLYFRGNSVKAKDIVIPDFCLAPLCESAIINNIINKSYKFSAK